MDYVNAFVGWKKQPTEKEVRATLGSAETAWNELVAWISAELGATVQEWKGVVAHKYGWSLRLKKKGRTIVYLGPGQSCFLVAFALSDKAMKATVSARLPKAVRKILATAPHYPEGTGVRLVITRPSQLAPVRTLAAIKAES